MAFDEFDREDLLQDGRTMGVRGQTVIGDVTVLIGFRDRGQASFYFGSERVFQFNQAYCLRRVYFDGRRFAAQHGTLVELLRQQRGGRLELVRRDVSTNDLQTVLNAIAAGCELIQQRSLARHDPWEVVGTTAEEFNAKVITLLANIPAAIKIADGPHA